MSKVLQTAAMVVGGIALVATGVGVAAAAGVFGTGIGAATAQVVAFTVAKYSAFAAAGLSFAGALTAPKPRFDPISTGTDWQADPYAGLPYAMGETAVGGQIIYRRAQDAWAGGAENDLQTVVSVLSCAGPVESIDGVDVDRNATTFNASTGEATGPLAGYVWWKGQLGATPESAQINIAAGSSSAPAGWTSAHKLSGLAADMVRMRYDSKGDRFGLSEPQIRRRGKWVKVYDPRLDSTYPGGSGACRPFNESTYVWSRNPHLHALTWAMGRYANGKLVCGLGAPMANIIVDQFIEGANICDANGWHCDGVISTRPQTAWNSLKLILQAGGAEPYNTGGRIGCRNQMPRVAVGSITPGDLRGEASIPSSRPRRERKNIAFVSYRSPAHEYEMVDAAPVRFATLITADRDEERPLTLALPLVQDVDQATVLAGYQVLESREADPITYSLGLRFAAFKPGDCLTDDTPEGGGQLLRIERRVIDLAAATVTLVCRTETTAKHAQALALVGQAPPVVTPPAAPAGPPAPASGAWTATGTAISDTGGAIPALVISGAADNAAATEILFWYRPTGGDGVWRAAGSGAATATRHEITAVTPGTQYDVAISYRVRGMIGARRVLGPVTAGEPVVVWANVAGAGRPEDGATATAPGNANRVQFSEYERGQGWQVTANPAGLAVVLQPVTFEGLKFISADVTFTAAGQTITIGQIGSFPVAASERLSIGSGLDAFALTGPAPATWRLYLDQLDAAGAPTQANVVSGSGTTSALNRRADFVTVRSDTRRGRLQYQVTSSAAGVLRIALLYPMVTGAADGQTLHPDYVRGLNADDGADVTPATLPGLPRGNWVSASAYFKGDIVQFATNTYVCRADHTAATGNRPPDATYWQLLSPAADGAVSGTPGGSGATTGSTSYGSTPAIEQITCRAGPLGQIVISHALSGFADAGNDTDYGIAAKWQRDIGGIWTDVAAETSIVSMAPGTGAAFGAGLNQTLTGLGGGSLHNFRLLIRRLGAGGAGNLVSISGSATLQGG
ncbi:MAG: hypothetical protein KGQ52_13480 [Alphaproteobacteria bacterium]|nr:hypothetical protein [Alphaproteobacteria bacterium]